METAAGLGCIFSLLHLMPYLHVRVKSVRAYDVSNIMVALKPHPRGWEAELELSNWGFRRTTVTEIALLIGDKTLPDPENRDLVLDPGDARTITLHFLDRDLDPNVERYALRVRDGFGKTVVKRGRPSPPQDRSTADGGATS